MKSPLKGSLYLVILIVSAIYFSGNIRETILPSESRLGNAVIPLTEHPEYKNLLELQAAFVRNAKLAKPMVVNISNVKETVNLSSWYEPQTPDSPPWYFSFKKWFVDTVSRKKFLAESVGSGLIIDSRGHILTNYHVVEDTNRLLVRLADGREYYADIRGTDSHSDLAVIKINSFKKLPVPVFGSTRNLKVGQWVMAIGNPYGLEGTVTVGVVSGTGRSELGIATFENFIQTDASINPGNSGGPLIDLNGKIIGINTAVASIGSGVGFAIPIEMALHISDDLINKGSVERGWLGVGIQSMNRDLASSFDLIDLKGGVLVNSVQEKTPAKAAGVLRGDIIIRYDGKKVSNPRKFQNMVANTEVGKRVTLKVIRDGREKTLHIHIGKYAS